MRWKAKAQAQRLLRLNGQPCDLHIGAITYFSSDTLHFYWRDPDPEKAEHLPPLELDLPDGAWANYYSPVADLIRARRASGSASPGDSIRLIEIDEADVALGAHPKILPLLLEARWTEARDAAIRLGDGLKDEGIRADGLIVRAGESWRRPLAV